MNMKKFWNERFLSELKKYKYNTGIKPTRWTLIHLLILKYNLKISPRGYGANDLTDKIFRLGLDKRMNEVEIKFLSGRDGKVEAREKEAKG